MSGVINRRQKRMGPAPFASFEDLSDELDSPEEKNATIVRLPGIREDATPSSPICPGISLVGAAAAAPPMAQNGRLQTPSTPRIDISRASSSSHHDSRESSPERELFEPTATLGLGFREEGTLDLRSSTEELDFQDPHDGKRKGKTRPPSPSLHDDSHHQRKDSQSSELGLLCISGRTSRLSSIGSQGSGQSRLSNASHLSVISGQSGLSRSPSPHKMLLETSFCGTKPPHNTPSTTEPLGTKVESEVLEKVLLSRKQDPTQAVLAEGISVAPDKPLEKNIQSVKSDIMIKVDEPSASNTSPNIPRKIISKSGVEYIYIPLKGPLPKDPDSKPVKTPNQLASKPKSKSASPSPTASKRETGKNEPKYIRIKLKPDHMYSDDSGITPSYKPDTLELNERKQPEILVIQRDETPQKVTPTASPKLQRQTFLKDNIGSKTPSPSLSRKSSFASIFRSKETILSPESPTIPGCRRKNTISGILRDASESLRDRSRSRSKSRERDRSNLSTAPSSTESIDSKSKQKSVFSIFKPRKADGKARTEPETELPNLEGIAKVEFKFNDSLRKSYETPLQADSIRIPLHSPTHYDEKSILQDLQTPSLDSQDTVVEVSKNVDVIVEPLPLRSKAEFTKRHSSTSSENVVFSTNLGSTDEIFSTKLPKDKETLTKLPPEVNGLEEIVVIETVAAVQVSAPDVKLESPQSESNRNSIASLPAEDERYSSESERDSEADFPKSRKDLDLKLDLEFMEPERKGLVLQQDSYEDELPYIPTTLPQERSAAVPIIPIKQRTTYEMKTYPIERPRSTTPINPSCLEEYCEEVMGTFNSEIVTATIEKLKISLPRHDSVEKATKSPRKPVNTTWFEFAEKGISAPGRRPSLTLETDAPPLPPKGVQKEWINFEEIPERRKPPRRIQTLPSRSHIDAASDLAHDVVYNYVNPEECKCECHELTGRARDKTEKSNNGVYEDELPLLDDEVNEETVDRLKLEVGNDRRSVVSDSSIDLSTAVEPSETNGGLDLSLRTPFTSDLGLSSNRSSVVSQDEPESSNSGSPNAFP